MVKHKIDGALYQNTNSNTIFKLIKLEQKKKRKRKKCKVDPSKPRWGGGHVVVGGEKRLSSSLCRLPTIFVCV